MGTASWALPVGILAGLCVLMFVFIWWWFPRAYKKGVRADMDRVDDDRRTREAYDAAQRDLEMQADANAAAGEHGDGTEGPPPQYTKDGTVATPAPVLPRTFKYTPQAYTSY